MYIIYIQYEEKKTYFYDLDQRVVYNFLQEINNKPIEKPTDKPPAKGLDDVLNNLKK